MEAPNIVHLDELLASNILELEALVRILVRKGITIQDEILDEIIKIRSEADEQNQLSLELKRN